MGIEIRIEDEHGELLGSEAESTLPGNPNCLNWLLRCTDISRTSCLKFIDPNGDTTFNRAQAMVLLDELAVAQKQLSEEAMGAAIAKEREQLRHFNIPDSEVIWSPSQTELTAFLSQLRAMIAVVIERPHRYIKFVGD